MKTENVLDIVRKILSVLTVLFLFLPWIVCKTKMSGGGVSSSSSSSEIGIKVIVTLLVPIALVLTIFLSTKHEKWKALYLYAPIAGVVITVLVGLFYRPGDTGASAGGVSASVDFSWGIGLWLTLIDYVAIFGLSLFMQLKGSNTSLKEDGIKNVAKRSVSEMKNSAMELAGKENAGNDSSVSSGASDNNVKKESEKSGEGFSIKDKIPTDKISMDKINVDSLKNIKDKLPTGGGASSTKSGDMSGAKLEFLDMKSKLEDARQNGIITDEEYDKKLSVAKVNFVKADAIERIETQYEFGIITEEEKNEKIAKLSN